MGSKHIAKGKGVLGIHAALASFLDGEDAEGGTQLGSTCSIIQDIFGAHFLNHPPVQEATVNLNRKEAQKFSPELYSMLPESFVHCDEFFNYSKDPIFYIALGHFSHFYNGEGPRYVATFLRAGLKFVAGEYSSTGYVNKSPNMEEMCLSDDLDWKVGDAVTTEQ